MRHRPHHSFIVLRHPDYTVDAVRHYLHVVLVLNGLLLLVSRVVWHSLHLLREQLVAPAHELIGAHLLGSHTKIIDHVGRAGLLHLR